MYRKNRPYFGYEPKGKGRKQMEKNGSWKEIFRYST